MLVLFMLLAFHRVLFLTSLSCFDAWKLSIGLPYG